MKLKTYEFQTTRRLRTVTFCSLVAITLSVSTPALASSTQQWPPGSTERFMKLPPKMFEQAIEREVTDPGLRQDLSNSQVSAKTRSERIAELKEAGLRAEGEIAIELRHQVLTEKREYVHDLGMQLDLRQQHVENKRGLLDRILKEINAKKRRDNSSVDTLRNQQISAQARLDQVIGAVDMQILGTEYREDSKYSREYASNREAAASLLAAIERHAMNTVPQDETGPMSREEYIRKLLIEVDTEMALIENERELLGYMARLVALDAMSLAEDVAQMGFPESGDPMSVSSTAESAQLFVD